MTLRNAIAPDCTYTPCDILPHHPDIVVANLNLMQFPEGEFDVTVMLGVIEYLENPTWVLRTIRSRSKRLVLSHEGFRFWTPEHIVKCEKWGRVNYIRPREMEHMLQKAGWRIAETRPLMRWKQRLKHHGTVYSCE